ncbi:MAG: hypothetical protein MJZ20_02835 [Bacteroidaceae bacterium]|nr:hypothetical protein [Bacteroidaceae bacterium]
MAIFRVIKRQVLNKKGKKIQAFVLQKKVLRFFWRDKTTFYSIKSLVKGLGIEEKFAKEFAKRTK